MQTTKVLYIVGSSNFGGVETFIRTTARIHASGKIEAHYLLLQDGPLAQDLEKAGRRVSVLRTKARLRYPWQVLRAIWEIRSYAVKNKINLVHSSMAYSALFGSWAAALAGKPHIWFQHGPVGGWMDTMAGNFPSRCILYNSKYSLAQQLRRHSFFREKILRKSRVVHLGTVLENLPPINANPSAEYFKILMLSRAQPWKGVDIFIAALQALRKKNNKFRARIFLPEIDGAYYKKILAMAEGLGDVLTIEEPSYDVARIFSETDCLVNASVIPEPFGLTLIEAMSFRVVPIAPRAGGPLEIIEENESGLFFEPCNAFDLAAKLELLMHDRDLLSRLKEKSRIRVESHFSESKMRNELERLYSQLA